MKRQAAVPYENATSGDNARAEITKILRNFGCSKIGLMDNFATHEILLAFEHRGRSVQLRASAKGWAAMYMKARPFNNYRKTSRTAYEQAALAQGQIAVNSILRDWIKGQITAIETGIMQFEEIFLPFMIGHDGRRVIEQVKPLLESEEGST